MAAPLTLFIIYGFEMPFISPRIATYRHASTAITHGSTHGFAHSLLGFKNIQGCNIINLASMMLLPRVARCFGRTVGRTWNDAQPIFKDYYSRRLTLSPHELEKFVIRLSEKQFSEADHRWTSLLQNVESCLPKYQLHSRLYMLKALSGMKSKAALLEKLQESLLQEVNSLTFEEAALLLWCLSKTPGSNKVEEATRIYRRLCDILKSYESQDGLTILIGRDQEDSLEQRVLSLKSTSICMVFSAMAHLGISEKTVIKHLLRSGVRPNAPAFSVNGLVTLLISLEKLGFRNRRDSMHIYTEIRKRYQQLEMGPIESIVNLAWSIANLSLSKHFDEAEYDGSKKPEETVQKMRQTKADMKKFLLWLCETIILRQQALGRQMAAKIVHYCAKAEAFDHGIWSKSLEVLCKSIEDCKIIDLVMALRAVSSLQPDERNSLKEQEETISKRLWVLHSSISGKSLQILSHLYRINRITPPPKICELLSGHPAKQEPSQQARQRQQE